jgi:23S rRNA (uridine2552-2'-O)-methyltransferase
MRRKAPKGNRREDHFSRRARREKYPARSVYKLQEIQHKFKIIHRGDRVLDLGCSPGSWLLYAARATGERGRIVGIDLNPVSIPLPDHATVHVGDVQSSDDLPTAFFEAPFQVVLSDMAPSTTGQRDTDAARSYRLCRSALALARRVLMPGGHFVCKIFQGPDFQDFHQRVKENFKTTKVYKPQSSRKASKEIFVIGLGFQKRDHRDDDMGE